MVFVSEPDFALAVAVAQDMLAIARVTVISVARLF